MAQNSQKAKVATVDYGFTQVEGLLLPSGQYYIGISQVANLLPKSIPRDRSLKQLKALISKDFKSHIKVQSDLHFKKVNAIDLNDLTEIIQWAAFSKLDQEAFNLIKALMQETLERRFDKAFDKQRSEEEYNARLSARTQGKEVRWELTDSIKAYIQRNNITGNKAKFMYKNVTDRLYKNLTGYNTPKLRAEYDIPVKATPRDYGSERDLRHVKEIEAAAQRYIDTQNMKPLDAIDKVSGDLLLKNVGWNRQERIK